VYLARMSSRLTLQARLPDRVAPQLATVVTAPPVGRQWVYEVKFDGYRILARCDHGLVRLLTRNGNDWTAKMPRLAREVGSIPVESAWFDGEIVVLGEDGLPDFNALQNAFDKRQIPQLTYFIFDALFVDGVDLRGEAFRTRRKVLEGIMAQHAPFHVRLSRTFMADGPSVLASACKMGLEGIVAKRLDSPYTGRRNGSWLKIKCQRQQAFVVGGFVLREGSAREVGSLLLGVYDEEGRLRYAGSVGTGWDSARGGALLTALSEFEADQRPFDPAFPPTKG